MLVPNRKASENRAPKQGFPCRFPLEDPHSPLQAETWLVRGLQWSPTSMIEAGVMGGFHGVMGLPQARWMVYVMENPKIKWMVTTIIPISGNPQPCTGGLNMLKPGCVG